MIRHWLLGVQEDAMLRAAVARFGERDWASVSTGVPGRSAKSCSDRCVAPSCDMTITQRCFCCHGSWLTNHISCRWRNFLSPDIAHPRKNPFSPWEVAVVVEVSTIDA